MRLRLIVLIILLTPTLTAFSQGKWPAWANIANDTVYCFTPEQARELWRVYNSRDMYRELYDSARMVINQRDMIIMTQEEIIASFEQTIKNDSIIRKQDSVLYSALEQKYKHQKIMTRVFQGSTLLFFLLLLF